MADTAQGDTDQEAMAAAWDATLSGEDVAGDDLSAQWAAMVDSSGLTDSSKEGSKTRIINQNEIDSLVGFHFNEHDVGLYSGIQAIINSSQVAYERLPLLEIVFDRLVRLMTSTLRNFTSDNVEVTLESLDSNRFGDYLNSIPLPAILSVFKVDQWDNNALVTVGSELVYSMIDVLLGGGRVPKNRIEGRPFTTIEMSLMEQMIKLVLSDTEVAFNPVSEISIHVERTETNPRFATIVRPADVAIVAKLRIDIEDRGGVLDMVIPLASLEPIRKHLMQMFMGEKFGRDAIWEEHIASQIWSSSVSVDAVFFEQTMPMSKVYDLKLGDTLMLERDDDEPVTLRCGAWALTSGTVGKVDENVAVRVDKPLNKSATSIDSFESLEEI